MTPSWGIWKHRRIWLVLILVSVGYGTTVYWRLQGLNAGDPVLHIRQIEPQVTNKSTAQTFLATSGQNCEFTFEFTNQGSMPLLGLRVATPCRCQITTAPENLLKAGESTRFSVALRAPMVGESRIVLPVYIDGQTKPVNAVEVTFRVAAEPPILVKPLGDLSLSTVSGQSLNQVVEFATVERPDSEKWIAGLEFEPPDLMTSRLIECRESQMPDGELTLRTYRYELTSQLVQPNAHRGTVQLIFAHTPDSAAHPHSVVLTVHDAISVFPKTITVNSGKATRIVAIVRSDEYRVELGEYSADLSVSPSTTNSAGNSFAFDLQAVDSPTPPDRPGKLQLLCRKGTHVETRELLVHFESSRVSQ